MTSPHVKASPRFRYLALATLLGIFALTVLGSVVRITDSGLGCPDWPLCHGKIIPPFDAPTLIEYSHRLVAAAVGLLVLATFVAAWRNYRSRPWIFRTSLVALVMVVAQSLLGGAAVLTELSSIVVMIHMAMAQALLACFILISLDAWRGLSVSADPWNTVIPASEPESRGEAEFREYLPGDEKLRSSKLSQMSRFAGKLDTQVILSAAAALGVYLLILSGSYVALTGASGACNQWPLCQGGKLWIVSELPLIHFAHRIVSVIALALLAAAAWTAYRTPTPKLTKSAIHLAIAIFAAQILVGALTVWWGLPTALRALHVALATLTWAALTTATLLPLTPTHAESERPKVGLSVSDR